MLSLGPFKPFLFNSYIGNSENPPITDEIWWSLDVRYCGAQLYFFGQWKEFTFIFFFAEWRMLFWC